MPCCKVFRRTLLFIVLPHGFFSLSAGLSFDRAVILSVMAWQISKGKVSETENKAYIGSDFGGINKK